MKDDQSVVAILLGDGDTGADWTKDSTPVLLLPHALSNAPATIQSAHPPSPTTPLTLLALAPARTRIFH